MTRRELVLGLTALLVAAGAAGAAGQQARVGLLGPDEQRFEEVAGGLRDGLRDLGLSDAATAIVEARVPRGDRAAARRATERLLQERVGVLFAIGSELARTARDVSPEVSVVFLTPGDPVASGLVRSLARPGNRMTGMTYEYPELSGKRLELLRDIVPRAQRVLVVHDPRDASPRQAVQAARDAAARLGVTLVEREVRSPDDLPRALQALPSVDAVLGIPGGSTSASAGEIVRAATAGRRPTVFPGPSQATAHALATYGVSDVAIARQAARLVEKILAGAPAGDLPVERPTKVELVVNLKTARALGLTVAPEVVVRADRVIE